MKFNAIEMMRSLSDRCFSDLEAIGASEGVHVCNKYSKVELICAIIANRAAMANSFVSDRTRYRFREMDGTEHYVMLTPEQERFMRWNHDNAIDYDNIDIDVIEDIDWETP